MTTAHIRRGAVALLSGAALIAPAVFLLSSASAAAPVVTVRDSRIYSDPIDGDVIVGEVQNTGDASSGLVALDVTWLDSSGNVISTDQGFTSSTLQSVPPGSSGDTGNRSPFRAVLSPPSTGYASYRLAALPTTPNREPNHNFAISVTSRPTDPVDGNGFHHVLGTVTNTNTTSSDNVNLAFTMYDGAGKVVDEAVSSIGTLAPGVSTAFDVPSDGSQQGFVSVAGIAESDTAPAPGVSPSPSASSAGPSPTVSPTVSPTMSPTPTMSTPPLLPCRTGGGSYAIAATPSYKKIVKGTGVRVSATLTQAGRLCQAGIRLSVYARGPGTTLYHLSKSMTTASTGKAFADYIGVKADFRWYVVSSGAHSATNLVQAR